MTKLEYNTFQQDFPHSGAPRVQHHELALRPLGVLRAHLPAARADFAPAGRGRALRRRLRDQLEPLRQG
eukprot:313574-Alexandrium_andersonii.AAC.1